MVGVDSLIFSKSFQYSLFKAKSAGLYMQRMITRTAESSEEGEDDMWRAG